MPNLIPGSLFNYSLIWMPVTKAFSFEPMLCESIEWPREGNQWHYEPKLDGFRAIGHKGGAEQPALVAQSQGFLPPIPRRARSVNFPPIRLSTANCGTRRGRQAGV
jgi:hypothetical protein